MAMQRIIELFAVFLLVAVLRAALIVIYRLNFHPLANIPGPFIAKTTWLYSTWYNIVRGRFYLQVQELHEQYGPIVRITPNEIHLSDPENGDKIYYVGSRFTKDAKFYSAFGIDESTFTSTSSDVHRVKRAALSPFFSRKKVLELEGIVQEKAQKLITRMNKAFESGNGIDLHHGFRAISIDAITDYAFDNCYDFLDKDDFGVEWFNDFRDMGPAIWFFQQFPAVQQMAMRIPYWLAKRISGPLARMMFQHQSSRDQILRVKDTIDRREKVSRSTIFHQLLRPDAAEGYKIPTVDELSDESQSLLGAAADTTGNAMNMAAYQIVINPEVYARVSTELRDAFPNPDARMDYVTLEKLPYLTAVMKESLRLCFANPGRLPRVVPASGAEFHGYYAPPGTVVSMSSWMTHHNESIFPNAERFDPERWLDPKRAKMLEKYLYTFGKGSRQCVGMQLAYCELYVTLGRVFRQFDNLKTRAKSREELLFDDYFSAYPPKEHDDFVFERAQITSVGPGSLTS
ncbi:cytochrome P450 [Aspergillus undulatus]|uniref:cytochrome P450 n=1 Tax=Aspergillus undulatus TaxID=1810928 RepID=UPI003CCD143B